MTPEEVERIAALARLQLTPDELAGLTRDLGRILEHVGRLQSLPTEDVEATFWVEAEARPLRADEVRPGLSREEALANAPAVEDGMFRVPRMGEEG